MSAVDQLLISRVIQDGDISPLLDLSVRAEYFSSQTWGAAWEWIYGYWVRHSEVPRLSAVRRKFPSLQLSSSVEEPLSALVEELFSEYKFGLVRDGLTEAVDVLSQSESADATMSVLSRVVTVVNADLSRSTVESSDEFIGPLVQKYVNGGFDEFTGIPSGFSVLDDACGGLRPEQLATIVGLPKRMKSSFLLWMAMTAQEHGYNVGIVSFEMSNEEQKQRLLSLGAGVSLNSLQRGTLTERDHEKLFAYEEKVLDEGRGLLHLIHDVQSSTTVGGVAAKLEQLKLDAMYVDGVYLMDDELGENKGSPQALTNITRSLKRLAQRYEVPLVCTTQALPSRTGKRGVDMNSIAYTSSFAQDSDILLGVDRPDLQAPLCRFKVIAARSALGAESEVVVDYRRGVVEDRGVLADGASFSDLVYDGDDDDLGGY